MTGQRPDYDVLIETNETSSDGTPVSLLKIGVGFIHRTGYDRQRLGANLLFKQPIPPGVTKLVLLAPRNSSSPEKPKTPANEVSASVLETLRGNGVF